MLCHFIDCETLLSKGVEDAQTPVLKFVGYDKTYKADSESVISCDKKWVLFYIYIYKKDEYKTRDKPMLSWVSYDTK